MSKKEYFAYGSNLNFEQMAYRCPEATAVGIAKLDGYELAFRRGYLTILPKEGASVEGLIWSVTDHDESQLDCYEGYPTFYDKETMTVTDADGTPHEIMVYTMNAPYRDQLLPVSSRYNAVTHAPSFWCTYGSHQTAPAMLLSNSSYNFHPSSFQPESHRMSFRNR